VENAKVESRALAGPLDAAFRGITGQAEKPEWVGYSVAQIPGQRTVCCGNYQGGDWENCGTCQLEKDHDGDDVTKHSDGTVKLEGAQQLAVLFRLEAKQVTRIRVASEDCTLDAGGLQFIWLTGVKPEESVALLKGFVNAAEIDDHGERRISQGALTAIALSDGAAADQALASFVAPNQPEQLRKHTSFWLGAARGKEGFLLLQKMVKSDPSSDVRAHVAFALSVSHEPEALSEMIRMAHDDESAHVRGQALFWLAHKAGQKASAAIAGAIDNDPDTEVKKKAVFALSQMPKDEGVPKLIEVAKTNKNPAVRKQAMFWLGQSHDPRALEFFEQVLTR
jgi:HEAT repeat protein